MTLNTHLSNYLEYCQYRKELDPKTLKAYRIDLTQFTTYMSGLSVDKPSIESYITHLHKTYKQRTIKRKIASIKAYFSYLEEEQLIAQNPFHKIKVKFKEAFTLPRIIPRDAIEQLLNHMYTKQQNISGTRHRYALRDIAVVEMFFATGIRVCELSNMRRSCVDLKAGVIRIMGKGSKERFVQIGNPDVLKLMNEYYRENRQEIDCCGYFFVNNRGKRYSEQSIRLMLCRYTGEASIAIHITPHMFRHSVATYLLEEEVDISYIQRILGHSSIKTTQIYIHIASKKQTEILRSKHPRNKMQIIRAA